MYSVPLQGVASYTVRAGPKKIVQFREQSNSLDEEMVALAKPKRLNPMSSPAILFMALLVDRCQIPKQRTQR